MKTANQIIRAFLFSPDQYPGISTPEFEAVCRDARDFLAMEREVQEARALVKVNRIDEARKALNEFVRTHGGCSESLLEAFQFVIRLVEAQRSMKLDLTDEELEELALLKEALELASQSDQDFERENRGPNRVKEIAKEAASL